MTPCKKLYCIAELFNDDEAILATAIKIFQVKDDHKIILKNITNQNIDQYSSKIDILFKISQDKFCIDGFVELIEAIHRATDHGIDMIKSNIDTGIIVGEDTVKGSQLSLFENDEVNDAV